MANINIKLNKNFTTQFNKMQEMYGEEFAKLNGLSDGQLSHTDFIDNFVDKDVVADVSIDSSANVAQKDVVTLLSEMSKPQRKLLAYNKIYYELNKKYGFKTANEWLRADWTKALHLHDADTSTFYSYCFAYDLADVAEKGLFFIENYNAEPPKHLDSFVQILMEWVCFCARRQAGAVGMPNLIPYLYYFWSRDVKKGYYTVDPDRYARQQVQALIYRLNQPWVRDAQSAFTNVSIFDHNYLDALFGGSVFPDGEFMIDELEGIMDFQKLFCEVVADIRSKNMFTFPVLSFSLLRKDGKFIDEEFARWACEQNCQWYDYNFFVDDNVTSLSNCCRLKSNIEDLGYFNSIGGTALKVGSVKVSTINLARIAYEHPNEKDYLVALKEMTELDLKVLDCVRHIIARNVEKGLLPNFSYGLLDFDHLYNTIGVLGVYETMRSFGYVKQDEFGNTYYTEDAFRFGKRIFEVIHNTKDQFALDKDYHINLEQIPGESCAAKMQQADTMLYPDEVINDLPLYGNQFIPLGIKTTIQERTRIAAAFDSYCNGGSIMHFNIEAPFSNTEQAWKMLNYVSDQGVTYFAFNIKIQACKHNHAFFGKVCPICGEPVDTEYTRIVGFYTPIKTWSKERKAEYKLREWHDEASMEKTTNE